MCVVVMAMRLVIGMMIVRMAVIVSGRLMVVRFVVVRLVVVMDGVGVMFAVVRLRFTGLHAFVPVRMVLSFYKGWAACEGSPPALSTTSLWTRSPWPRRRALRWRERPRWRLERFSLSSSASRCARSSASISA